MAVNDISIPQAGQTVIVRNRPALVRSVDERSDPNMPATHEVQVEYIDGWSHPDSDYLIWELERGARVVASLAIPRIDEPGQFPDDPALLHAFLRANRWSAINRLSSRREQDEQELRLISPWQSAVQVEDYQLYPVLKAMLMPRISLLLADDVGMGKTIEAGLIISELYARRRIRRVLIVCPASLQLQWRDEMRKKLHLDCTIVDRDETFRLQRELGVDSNPWASYPRIITSMDYLRQKDVLGSFVAATNSLAGRFEAILPWQMLVVDEVHNLTPSSYGDDSDRCEMLRRIAPHFEHRLFLSATPHNGYTVSFTGLLELLDPVRFQQKAMLDEQDHRQVYLSMVRRLKQELTEEGEEERFAPRHVESLTIPVQGLEKQLFDALRSYREGVQQLLGHINRGERHLGEFLLKLLTKRLLSSSYAFARTWWRHVEGLNLDERDIEVTSYAIDRAEMAMNDDQERSLREEDAIEQTGAWLRRYAEPLKSERQAVSTCLEHMGWSVQALQQPLSSISMPPDAKWERLLQWINDNLKRGSALRDDERLILFTEYKHTLDYFMERLRRAGLESPQVENLYGGALSEQRERIKDAFNDPSNPLRILVGTDTVSEGISLQITCRYVVHLEIPWNPMRLEQRNGRVDRHGQERDVYAFHFTSDDEADLQFMARVVEKVNQARSDLGSVGQVIDSAILQHFTQGTLSDEALEERIQAAQQHPQEEEDLRTRDKGSLEQSIRAMQRLAETEMVLDLSPEHAAHLLMQAVAHEQGELYEFEVGRSYRFRKVPPTWKKLVRETIERQSGSLIGLPKLVFDPASFEERHNGRRIFKPRTDAELIRLGHPLMQRAIGVLRRRMWDSKDMTRWTLEGSMLPGFLKEVLLLHLYLEVTNEFREVAHQEVIQVPFEVRGYHLHPLEQDLWARLESLPRTPLAQQDLHIWTEMVRDQWDEHQRQIRTLLTEQREHYHQEFAQRMQQRLQEEIRAETAAFQERLQELERQKQPRYLEALQQEIEKQRKRLLQPALFTEIQQEHQQRLQQLEWDLAHTYLERMKALVLGEQQRILEQVLPKRYALATVDLQPLAVEYIVRSAGHAGKEQR
jgi:ERCC4-related helicase